MSMRVQKDTHGEGLRRLRQRLRGGRSQVLVGVPANKREEDGTSTALVAAVNEFGTADGRVPERSFLRAGIREGQPRFRILNKRLLTMIANGAMSEGYGLELLGQAGVGAVKEKMLAGPFAPNADSTIARKGSDKPLFDTSQLFQSITYTVEAKP